MTAQPIPGLETVAWDDQYLTVVYRVGPGARARELLAADENSAASWSHAINDRDRVAAALRAVQEERDAALADLEIAREGQKCECSPDDFCRLARERDAALAECERLRVGLQQLAANGTHHDTNPTRLIANPTSGALAVELDTFWLRYFKSADDRVRGIANAVLATRTSQGTQTP